jgi:hypothetical protein
MSHVLKLFLKVIQGRIYNKCEETITESQFGFRNGLGTRDALFCMQVLVQRCMDMKKDIYACFIDYEKAFDRVQHEKLIKILQRIGLDYRDIRIIVNLYWNQKAAVSVEDSLSADIQIRRGVRQGCVLSPMLFNIYSEAILAEALNDTMEGIVINGEVINNVRYADDTVLLADSITDLQTLLEKVNVASNGKGLNMNVKKTKFMIISKQHIVEEPLILNGIAVERVNQYKYLGCCLNEQWIYRQEIMVRIELARNVFLKMKKLLCNRNLNIKLRMRMVRCYVFSTLLYGVEGWTLTGPMQKAGSI